MTETHCLRLACRVAGRRKIAGYTDEDVEQEAILIGLQALRDEPGITTARMETKVLNGLRALYRRANKAREEQDDAEETRLQAEPSMAPSVLDLMISDETLTRLASVLGEKEHALVKMLFWEHSTEDDARKELGMTTKTFQQAKRRIFEKIRESLKPE
jgi:DNA-directed RNA polymerase specialized sigma subunit